MTKLIRYERYLPVKMTPIVNGKDIKTLIKKDKLFADIYKRHKSPSLGARMRRGVEARLLVP